MQGDRMEAAVAIQEEMPELRPTEPPGIVQDFIEHWLQLAGRTRDDLQHLAGGSLVVERLLQLARARLHVLEQARVLDGDHGLVGERLKQGDLLVAEGRYGCP